MFGKLFVASAGALMLAAAASTASAQSCQAVNPNRTLCRMVLNDVETMTIEGDGQASRIGHKPFKARIRMDVDGIRCLDKTHGAWLFSRTLKLAGQCRLKFVEGEHLIAVTVDATGGTVDAIGAKAFPPDRLSALPIGPLK
jgi:hypothetical protein